MKKDKTYFGDSVYAELDIDGDLILSTDNGIRVTNKITLEPQIVNALCIYLGLERKVNKENV